MGHLLLRCDIAVHMLLTPTLQITVCFLTGKVFKKGVVIRSQRSSLFINKANPQRHTKRHIHRGSQTKLVATLLSFKIPGLFFSSLSTD